MKAINRSIQLGTTILVGALGSVGAVAASPSSAHEVDQQGALPCTAEQVVVATHRWSALVVTNIDPVAACSLSGYATLTPRNAEVSGTPSARRTEPPTTVVLQPGKQSSAPISLVPVSGYDPALCRATPATHLRYTDAGADVQVAFDQEVAVTGDLSFCTGAELPSIVMGPFNLQ